jgi:hypothetical protein
VQEHHGFALWVATLLEIELVELGHPQPAAAMGFNFGVKGAPFRSHANSYHVGGRLLQSGTKRKG